MSADALQQTQAKCEASVAVAVQSTPTFKHVFTFTSKALQFDAEQLWNTAEEARARAAAHVRDLEKFGKIAPQAVVWGIALFPKDTEPNVLQTNEQSHIVAPQYVPHQPESYLHDTRGVYVVDVLGNTGSEVFFCIVPYDPNMPQELGGNGPPIAGGYFDDNLFVDTETTPSRLFLQLRQSTIDQ